MSEHGIHHVSEQLGKVTPDQLISELRSRGYVVSAWSIEDVRPAIENDDDFAGRLSALSDEEVSDLADATLFHPDNKLEDVLAERGNTHLGDFWAMFKDDIFSDWEAEKADVPKV